MSKRPTGTLLDDERLLELRETDETAASELAIDVTPVAEHMGASSGDHIDWGLDRYEDQTMLVISGIAETATADAPYPRQLRDEEGAIVAPVPDLLVRAAPPEGLGLDLETYDDDRPLLFDAITTAETIGLVPVRYDDGQPYRPEPLPGVADESDPVAEGTIEREARGDPTPRPETMDAPIDPVVFDDVMADVGNDVPASDVIGILEAIERHELVGEDAHAAGRPPLSVDDRAVVLLPADAWPEQLAPELEAAGIDVNADALEAAREVHERQAAQLIDEADADEYRTVRSEYDYDVAVSDERDTAEWNVSEPGTVDRDGT
ncbi:hypothetical protein [Halopiger djelfimassiliensis]|uniref:hypothetical protein n=1 Tax=Halopiger djelfimassiliensis TaxID=1293047 RepID=UPI0006780337|nr:hypothetical protein [Halopiger djelfimassiliensis]